MPVVGICMYANSLWNPFIFDDHIAIIDNPIAQSLWPPNWLTAAWSPEKGAHGRPVVNLTLAINYAIDGLNVFGYHAFNLLIHTLNAIALTGVLSLTLQNRLSPSHQTNHSHPLAVFIALLWFIHPLHTQCINYVTQRSELLMGLFFLLTLYCAIQAFHTHASKKWAILAIISCALGMASKEVMVVAPIVVFLYDRTFISHTFCHAIRKHWPLHLGLVSTWVILALLLLRHPHGETIGFATPLTGWDYLKNQFIAITTYLKLVIWPHPLILDYGFPINNLPLTSVIPQALFITFLGILTVYALKYHPKIGFLGACFFLIITPTSSIVPIVNEVAAERRMYLPLIPCIILIALGLYALFQRQYLRSQKWLLIPLCAIPILALTLRTISRNTDHQTEQRIWENVTQHLPQNPRAWNVLGHLYTKQKRYTESLPYFEKALEQKPDFIYALYNFGHALTELGRPDEAWQRFSKAIALDPDNKRLENWLPKIHNNLGVAYLKQDNMQRAIHHFQKVIIYKPDHYLAHNNMGVAYLQLAQYEQAIAQFRAALKIKPDYDGAKVNLQLTKELLQNP